jgi:hypothetical protein
VVLKLSARGLPCTTYFPIFLDATATEAYLCRLYELPPEQVAAARAYVLNNPETVLTRHLDIEARMAAGNPPEVRKRAEETHAAFLRFKDWLTKRQQAEAQETAKESTPTNQGNDAEQWPSFQEWLAQQRS